MNPILKKWEWHFKKEWAQTIGDTIVAFTEFICFGGSNVIEFPEDTIRLKGMVYGRDGFNDGDEITTSNIVKIERLSTNSIPQLVKAGDCGNRFAATTSSGTCYEFVEAGLDGMSPGQFLAFGSVIHGRR